MKRADECKQKACDRVIALINEFCGSETGREQQAFADMCGVSKSSISQYVNRTNAPGNETAAKIAQKCGVNPLWVMGISDTRSQAESNRLTLEAQDYDDFMHEIAYDENQRFIAFINDMKRYYHELNFEGQEALWKIAESMTYSPQYKKDTESHPEKAM